VQFVHGGHAGTAAVGWSAAGAGVEHVFIEGIGEVSREGHSAVAIGNQSIGIGATSMIRWLSTQPLDRRWNDPLRELLAALSAYGVWRLDIPQIDSPWQVQRVSRISPDGQLAAALLDQIRDTDPGRFDALQRDLRTCAPEIARVVAEAHADRPGYKEIVFHEVSGYTIRCVHASEGLKFLLYVLLILHSPEPPRFFGLEEIEHGLHPARIADVLGFLRRLTGMRGGPQIMLTSHSPIVVDQFRESPEDVVVLDRGEDGATRCQQLSKRLDAIGSQWRERALGDLWYSGVLGGVPKT
jgi:predicted ATPase